MARSEKEEELLRKWKVKEWKAKDLERQTRAKARREEALVRRLRAREQRAHNLERLAKSKVKLIEARHTLRNVIVLLILAAVAYAVYVFFLR